MTAGWIFFGLAMSAYAGAAVALHLGLRRRFPMAAAGGRPSVTVLIAARNEEHNLPRCLDALLKNDYPTSQLEVLVVDDRSTDGTRRVAEEYAQRCSYVRVLTIRDRLDGMSGKASALCRGMERARGEIVLMTDADCIPPPQWISSMISGFRSDTGLVGGFTLLAPPPAGSALQRFWGNIQNVDWMYLLAVGAGATGLGRPVSVLGNNCGFRKVAYEAVGGYRALGFSIIEDFALMRAITRQTDWQASFCLTPGAALETLPPTSWRAFVEQRKRWAAGAREISGFGKLLLCVGFLRHAAIFAAVFLLHPLWPAFVGIGAAFFADFSLLWNAARRLQRRRALWYFPWFALYQTFYSLVLALVVALPITVRWRDVEYRWRFGGRLRGINDPQTNPS